jgi:hypothetical protein
MHQCSCNVSKQPRRQETHNPTPATTMALFLLAKELQMVSIPNMIPREFGIVHLFQGQTPAFHSARIHFCSRYVAFTSLAAGMVDVLGCALAVE